MHLFKQTATLRYLGAKINLGIFKKKIDPKAIGAPTNPCFWTRLKHYALRNNPEERSSHV